MAPEPRLLMLDEPAAGMNAAETEALATLVRRLQAEATTVLLAEHDMGFVMAISDTVRGITLHVPAGAVVCLIGANGAGKTTTMRAISGLLHPRAGRIRFGDAEITGQPAHRIAAAGLRQAATVAQNPAVTAACPGVAGS